MKFNSLLTIIAGVSAVTEKSFTLMRDNVYNGLVGSQQLLSNFEFAKSWNEPSEVDYTPNHSSDSFDRVVLELSVNTTGNNYDRLVHVLVDNIEVWRSSTAEPDSSNTKWTVTKDVSHYASLFTSQRKINVLIQNNVEGSVNGVFYVDLTAYFYKDPGSIGTSDDNWAVNLDNLPTNIQSFSSGGSSLDAIYYAASTEITNNVKLDRNVNRALLHIFASGSGDDEFWWDSFSGAGSSRIINVYINDQLAGIVAPFPTIFTGGIHPFLWKPMVGIHAFDIPAYFVDITPFLPALWDGADITLTVSNGINGEKVPYTWIISHNLLTWSTEGQENSGTTNDPKLTNSTIDDSDNNIVVDLELTTSATLTIGGEEQKVSFTQNTFFNNTLQSVDNGNQIALQSEGSSSISGKDNFGWDFYFPLTVLMSNNENRVQQTFVGVANGNTYYTWVDSSVTNDDSGSFKSSDSSQYLNTPAGAHFGSTTNLNLNYIW